jgi:hypothetical protein
LICDANTIGGVAYGRQGTRQLLAPQRLVLGDCVGRQPLAVTQLDARERALGLCRIPGVELPPRLLAHVRRWAAHGLARKTVVEWNGKSVESVRKGFAAAVEAAGLGADVTPRGGQKSESPGQDERLRPFVRIGERWE